MKVLITGAASAKAYQFKSKLSGQDAILGDYAELPESMLRAGSMLALPDPSDASYTHKMLTLSLDNGIDTIYALQPAEYSLLQEAEQLFNEYGITILQAGDEI